VITVDQHPPPAARRTPTPLRGAIWRVRAVDDDANAHALLGADPASPFSGVTADVDPPAASRAPLRRSCRERRHRRHGNRY